VIEDDMETDEEWTYLDQVLTTEEPEIMKQEMTTAGEFYLTIVNVSLPPDMSVIYNFK
jgi:hypothetical protein